MANNDFEHARDFALRYLGYAPRSRKQLRDKLMQNGFLPESIAATMELFEQKGYVDDVAFAASYISSKSRTNSYGKRRIVMGLLQNGVAKEDIVSAYNYVFEDGEAENELDSCKRALAKKISNKDTAAIFNNPKEKQRIVAFLLRRGFSYEIVKKALASK